MEDNENKEADMPVISMFFGIIITMNADDHVPPHIHARYQGHEASFTFDGNLLKGDLRASSANWSRHGCCCMPKSWKPTGSWPSTSSTHSESTRYADKEATDMTIDYSIKVTQCEPMPGYKLKVTCSDGATGIFDMSRYVDRGMFKPLKDPQTFDRVRLAFGVPSWPGDIDIAAERVRSDMQII